MANRGLVTLTLVGQWPRQGATDEWLMAAAHDAVRTQSVKCFPCPALMFQLHQGICPGATTWMDDKLPSQLLSLQQTNLRQSAVICQQREQSLQQTHPGSMNQDGNAVPPNKD